jgi:ribosomal protein S21
VHFCRCWTSWRSHRAYEQPSLPTTRDPGRGHRRATRTLTCLDVLLWSGP